MGHQVHRVTAFQVVGPYRIRIECEDGLSRTIAFGQVLAGELHGPLRELAVFDAVRLDPEAHTLVWPNGADVAPETLHEWPEYEAEMVALAKRWSSASRSGGPRG